MNQGGSRPVAEVVGKYKPQIDELRAHLGEYLQGADLQRLEEQRGKAEEWGVPEHLGRRWSELFEAFALLDVAKVAAQTKAPIATIAAVYYQVYARFEVDNVLERITALPRKDRWQALARAALRDDLYSTIADMTKAVWEATADLEPDAASVDVVTADDRLLAWEALNQEQLGRARSVFEEVNALDKDDMASLSVALRLLRSIVRP